MPRATPPAVCTAAGVNSSGVATRSASARAEPCAAVADALGIARRTHLEEGGELLERGGAEGAAALAAAHVVRRQLVELLGQVGPVLGCVLEGHSAERGRVRHHEQKPVDGGGRRGG